MLAVIDEEIRVRSIWSCVLARVRVRCPLGHFFLLLLSDADRNWGRILLKANGRLKRRRTLQTGTIYRVVLTLNSQPGPY